MDCASNRQQVIYSTKKAKTTDELIGVELGAVLCDDYLCEGKQQQTCHFGQQFFRYSYRALSNCYEVQNGLCVEEDSLTLCGEELDHEQHSCLDSLLYLHL